MLQLTQHILPPANLFNTRSSNKTLAELNIEVRHCRTVCPYCNSVHKVTSNSYVLTDTPNAITIHQYCPNCNKGYVSIMFADYCLNEVNHEIAQQHYIYDELVSEPYISICKLLPELNMCIYGSYVVSKFSKEPTCNSDNRIENMPYNMGKLLSKLTVHYLLKALNIVEHDEKLPYSKKQEALKYIRRLVENISPSFSYLHNPQCISTILYYHTLLDNKLMTKEHYHLYKNYDRCNILMDMLIL